MLPGEIQHSMSEIENDVAERSIDVSRCQTGERMAIR